MPSVVARVGLARLIVVAVIGVAALVALGLSAGAKTVRQRDRAQHVVALDVSAPAPSATASAGVTDSEASQAFVEKRSAVHHAPARAPDAASVASAPSPGIPSDAEVRRELRMLKRGIDGVAGAVAALSGNGQAIPPNSAPDVVARVIRGGNEIANFPYIWGGGHGSFIDNGYDCSGSVSYALRAGGLLKSPLTSGSFASWGDPGPGKWITIYANNGHVYMYVAGLRFDTSGRSGPRGSRWQKAARSNGGFVARHPPGL